MEIVTTIEITYKHLGIYIKPLPLVADTDANILTNYLRGNTKVFLTGEGYKVYNSTGNWQYCLQAESVICGELVTKNKVLELYGGDELAQDNLRFSTANYLERLNSVNTASKRSSGLLRRLHNRK